MKIIYISIHGPILNQLKQSFENNLQVSHVNNFNKILLNI